MNSLLLKLASINKQAGLARVLRLQAAALRKGMNTLDPANTIGKIRGKLGGGVGKHSRADFFTGANGVTTSYELGTMPNKSLTGLDINQKIHITPKAFPAEGLSAVPITNQASAARITARMPIATSTTNPYAHELGHRLLASNPKMQQNKAFNDMLELQMANPQSRLYDRVLHNNNMADYNTKGLLSSSPSLDDVLGSSSAYNKVNSTIAANRVDNLRRLNLLNITDDVADFEKARLAAISSSMSFSGNAETGADAIANIAGNLHRSGYHPSLNNAMAQAAAKHKWSLLRRKADFDNGSRSYYGDMLMRNPDMPQLTPLQQKLLAHQQRINSGYTPQFL